jgi:glycosyltransferase involved in cell wall biosynthesis
VLVVDDGSSDRTAQVAREAGADHVVRLRRNVGLARAFMLGLDESLRRGADIIVHTDADNQYDARDIAALIAPILDGSADVVVGSRPIEAIREFSFWKKKLQRLGSWVVRGVSRTSLPDATSGFRAYSKGAALRLTILSEFTYTLESVIQAGHTNVAVAHVPIRTNPATRQSRLAASSWQYVWRSLGTIIRIYVLYEPFRFFMRLGLLVFLAGFALCARYLYFYFRGDSGHLQSVILGAVLVILGFQLGIVGLLADLLAANRKLVQEALFRVRRLELERSDSSEV